MVQLKKVAELEDRIRTSSEECLVPETPMRKTSQGFEFSEARRAAQLEISTPEEPLSKRVQAMARSQELDGILSPSSPNARMIADSLREASQEASQERQRAASPLSSAGIPHSTANAYGAKLHEAGWRAATFDFAELPDDKIPQIARDAGMTPDHAELVRECCAARRRLKAPVHAITAVHRMQSPGGRPPKRGGSGWPVSEAAAGRV